MSMTDPIADFLTRIRNGIQAAHETVDIPASKLKVEMARILREQGYINAYEVEAPDADHPGEVLRVHAEVHRGPPAGDPGPAPRLAPRASATTRRRRGSARSRAAWARRSSPRRAAS